jgi:hypothetical protein
MGNKKAALSRSLAFATHLAKLTLNRFFQGGPSGWRL